MTVTGHVQSPGSEAETPVGGRVRPWVAIQRNRRSGAGGQYRAVMDLIWELRRQGWQPRLFSSRRELDAAIQESPDHPPNAIVAAGGDGTVLDRASRHPRLPVAILPLGTENLLAQHCGIRRRDGAGVARMIVAGKTTRLDLGVVDERRFSVLVSCGFDADVIRRAHESRRGHITRLHYVLPVVRSLGLYSFPEVRTYVDDDPEPIRAGMVVVANLPRYAMGIRLAPTARPDDGLLEIRAFPHRTVAGLFCDMFKVLIGRSEASPVIIRRQGRTVRIESDSPAPVEVDGDPIGTTPVTLQIEPAAATLYVP